MLGQSSHNVCALWSARQNFEIYLASHHQWLERTRNPLPHEARAAEWKPLDLAETLEAERAHVMSLIESAFAGIRRGGGVTLREARGIDDYEDASACAAARRPDTNRTWREVPDEDLNRYRDTLNFLDDEGFCYYLPAFMTWDLWHFRTPGASPKSELLFQLCRGRSAYDLTGTQSHAVYRYLQFLAEFGSEFCQTDARRALSNHWSRFATIT